MSNRRYAILRVGNFWRIVGRRQAEDFPTRDSVALATARLAAQAIQDGYQVELVISPPLNAQKPLESDRELPGPDTALPPTARLAFQRQAGVPEDIRQ